MTAYGKTELEEDTEKSIQCREIVKKIIEFGVNESQKIKIIKLLAMEIENRETMLSIIEACEGTSTKNERKKILST